MQVIDCGSQFAQNIYKFLRKNGYPISDGTAPQGYVISGGPNSAQETMLVDSAILRSGKPVLGICYGMQAMALLEGGVVQEHARQYGPIEVKWQLLEQLPPTLARLVHDAQPFQAWANHGDTITRLPDDYKVLATSGDEIAAMISQDGQRWGIQWHPEVSHSQYGDELLRAFADHCDLQPSPVPTAAERIKSLCAALPEHKALIAVSGGVDSTTLALLYQQSGRDFVPVFVETGLMRAGEAEKVEQALKPLLPNLCIINAKERFLSALWGVGHADEKRQIIGREFAELLQETAHTYHCTALAQGTLLSDVIESGQASAASERIKRHHNLEIPRDYALPVVEPFRGLFKWEVRELAQELGLAQELTQRMPFPGPGLAVRILGEVTERRLDMVRQADVIFQQLLVEDGTQCSQAFAALLNSKAVGVAGDAKRHDEIVCLRAVQSSDFMTANVAPLSMSLLQRAASRILNEVQGVARVMFDLSSKPPATIELE